MYASLQPPAAPVCQTQASASSSPGWAGREARSWRTHDRAAVAYDLDRKRRALAEAEALSALAGAFGRISEILPPLPKGAGFAVGLLGDYMGKVEAKRVRREIAALEARQAALGSEPSN